MGDSAHCKKERKTSSRQVVIISSVRETALFVINVSKLLR